MKRYFLLLILIFSGCTTQKEESNKINIVVSFYPLYEFTKEVGGNNIEIILLIPPNVEPHEYELKPSDMKKIVESDLFIYNGAEMEQWIGNILKEENVKWLDTSENIELIYNDYGKPDPHIWLAPKNVIIQVENIKNKLIEINPENAEEYENNANEYIIKLKELDEKIKEEISDCNKKDIVITHATLGYFVRDYELEQIPLSGINPEAEISIKDMEKVLNEIEGRNISVIFVEEQVNPKTAEIISNELNIKIMKFNTIHGVSESDILEGKNYVTVMEENIEKIKIALECGGK